jgi:threonine dehydrogenase-like Zn-dependent dehydrogenase
MRAVQFDGELHLASSYPDPQITGDQALIKVRCAGICNTDIELIKGYMGFSGILGHEFVGEVIAGSDALIGQRVVGEINVADGDCEFCKRGIPSQCVDRVTVGIDRHDGAFADHLALTVRNLHIVPDNVSDTAAVFVEPLAAALQVTEAVHISPRNRVVIIGAGKLGMLVAQILKLTGADISVVVRREKQARLLQKWGIPALERSELPDNSADVVVDCTGVADGFADALTLVKSRGVIVLKSTYVNLPQADLTRVVVDEIRVIGSRCGPFDSALRLLTANLVDVASLVEARYGLDDAIKAIDHASKKGVLKILLDV